MARVFVNWPRGPWQGLYVDGKLQDEGHEICLAGPPHDEYREYDFWAGDGDGLPDGLPVSLSDLPEDKRIV